MHRCERCGDTDDVRIASLSAWLCCVCATHVLRERRLATRRTTGRVTLDVAPAAIRRTEQHATTHYRKNYGIGLSTCSR